MKFIVYPKKKKKFILCHIVFLPYAEWLWEKESVVIWLYLRLVGLQDTLKSSPPENKVMKKATFIGVSTTTIFYMLCGCMGYAAFGNDAPGNFLTGFGFYEPFWLIDLANLFIAIHLIGAYQVKPLYSKNFMKNLFTLHHPRTSWERESYVVHPHIL